MSALGFAPVNPCGGDYVLGAPHFESISMDVGKGKKLEILAKGLSQKNRYVQSVALNGKLLGGPVIRHADVVKGGTLTYTMGDRPAAFWEPLRRDRSSSRPR
jgi:putative alpha-1,2-mannosidase